MVAIHAHVHACAVCRCLMPGYYVMRFGQTPHSLIGNAAGLKDPVYTQVRYIGFGLQG